MSKLKFYRKSVHSGAILLLAHIVCIIGIFTPKDKIFIALSPIFILLSFLIVVYNKRERKAPEKFFVVLFAIGIISFLFEISIANTPILYNHLVYSDILGLMIFNTPIVLSTIWIIHIVCIAGILEKSIPNIFAKSAISAALAGMLHALFLSSGKELGFWTMKKGPIPYQEFLISGLIYFFLFGIYYSFDLRKKNKIAWLFIILEIVFFSVILLFH